VDAYLQLVHHRKLDPEVIFSSEETLYLNGHMKTQINRDWRAESPYFILKILLHK
jgi:hypothetical protein